MLKLVGMSHVFAGQGSNSRSAVGDSFDFRALLYRFLPCLQILLVAIYITVVILQERWWWQIFWEISVLRDPEERSVNNLWVHARPFPPVSGYGELATS